MLRNKRKAETELEGHDRDEEISCVYSEGFVIHFYAKGSNIYTKDDHKLFFEGKRKIVKFVFTMHKTTLLVLYDDGSLYMGKDYLPDSGDEEVQDISSRYLLLKNGSVFKETMDGGFWPDGSNIAFITDKILYDKQNSVNTVAIAESVIPYSDIRPKFIELTRDGYIQTTDRERFKVDYKGLLNTKIANVGNYFYVVQESKCDIYDASGKYMNSVDLKTEVIQINGHHIVCRNNRVYGVTENIIFAISNL